MISANKFVRHMRKYLETRFDNGMHIHTNIEYILADCKQEYQNECKIYPSPETSCIIKVCTYTKTVFMQNFSKITNKGQINGTYHEWSDLCKSVDTMFLLSTDYRCYELIEKLYHQFD